jgi:hypothetical protein
MGRTSDRRDFASGVRRRTPAPETGGAGVVPVNQAHKRQWMRPCRISAKLYGVGWEKQNMLVLREYGIGVLGKYSFQYLPRIGDTIQIRQADKSSYFQVSDVEHVVIDPEVSAEAIVVVKRVVKWPGLSAENIADHLGAR